MRVRRRIAILFTAGLLGLTAPFVAPTSAACDPTPAAGEVTFFDGLNYSGTCVTKTYGSFSGAAAMGIPENDIASIKIGSPDGSSQRPRVLACQGLNFGGTCGSLAAGNIPDLHVDPELNFLNTISSFRVQAVKVNKNFIGGGCTETTAQDLKDYIGFYPGWTGNATLWDTKAKGLGWLVNETVKVSTIMVFQGSTTQTQKNVVWTGGSWVANGGSYSWTLSSAGHVAWIEEVRSGGWVLVHEGGTSDGATHRLYLVKSSHQFIHPNE